MTKLEPLKILIVDDDELDRMVIKRALKKAKQALLIIEAHGFQEATRLLRDNSFDCLLFDFRLGGRDGIELIQEIQAENLSQAPIVMLSGLDNEEVMLKCLKEGAQDFLLKSEITTHSLLRAIRYAQERKQVTLQLRFLAQHDTLTGLANRRLFIDCVKRAIAHARREDTLFAIIFIDVDNFKSINDSLGHEGGDELLTTIANRIKSTLRGEDIVGRLGGDEFSVLIEGIVKHDALIKIARLLLDAVREPINIYNKVIHTTISLGLATYPTCSKDASELIKCADLAMYKAKQSGRNNYYFYSADLQQLADKYANIKIDLYNALSREEFELYYQPQINASDGTIAGVEALIRWHHPTRGMVPPDEFIPVAESTGLINSMGDWVIDAACKQLSLWLASYKGKHSKLNMAINISTHQIQQQELKDKVCEIIDKYQLPYSQVELELTENALIDDIERCKIRLDALSKCGIPIAIDDFGTGFASFRHLQELPLTSLKIDKTFIDHICTKVKSHEIVKAIIVMARALNMTVIAEGVETQEQACLLQAMECDFLQGYYFSKPLPATELEKILKYPHKLPQIQKPSTQNNAQSLLGNTSMMKPPNPVGKKLTILLVDDDDIDAKVVERMLKKRSTPPKLVRAINGFEALKILQDHDPKVESPFLILLDLNMPKMSGLELLEAIRQDPKLQGNIVFILTTSSAEKDRVSAYKNHVAGYIVKSDAGPQYSHLAAMLEHYEKTVRLLS